MHPVYTANAVYGRDAFLAVCGKNTISFYDREDLQHVGRIDVETKGVYWSDQVYVLARHIVTLPLQCYLWRPWQILNYAVFGVQCVGRLEDKKLFLFLL